MYKRESQLLEQYPLEFMDTRRGRGALCCRTKERSYLLKVYQGSEERAGTLSQLTEVLAAKDLAVEHLIRNKQELYLVEDRDGERYLLTEYREGRECDIKNRREILKAVELLAEFHGALKSPEVEQLDLGFLRQEQSKLERMRKHTMELRRVHKYILGRKSKNEFEQLFLKTYGQFKEQAERVQEQLEKEQEFQEELIHGDFSYHNIILYQGEFELHHLEQIHYGDQMEDLGYFMRKILEKQRWNRQLGMDMLKAYGHKKQLTEAEKKRLFLYLSYPEKFWKLANHYLNTKKSWSSLRNVGKLETIQTQEVPRREFLEYFEETLTRYPKSDIITIV